MRSDSTTRIQFTNSDRSSNSELWYCAERYQILPTNATSNRGQPSLNPRSLSSCSNAPSIALTIKSPPLWKYRGRAYRYYISSPETNDIVIKEHFGKLFCQARIDGKAVLVSRSATSSTAASRPSPPRRRQRSCVCTTLVIAQRDKSPCALNYRPDLPVQKF
ncbi:MAG: hypothetical protein CM1200mP39_20540 [Dehalococcoidia bacterium]|nr:MAG: hypothetical protein CM1200mP39_20540 [Dehalococcoidia bacterium]